MRSCPRGVALLLLALALAGLLLQPLSGLEQEAAVAEEETVPSTPPGQPVETTEQHGGLQAPATEGGPSPRALQKEASSDDGLGSCSAASDDSSAGQLAEGCTAAAVDESVGEKSAAESGAPVGAEEVEKVKAELAALEERVLAGRALVAGLVDDIQHQEERVYELQRMLGAEAGSRLRPRSQATGRLSATSGRSRGGPEPLSGQQGGARSFRLARETWPDLMQPRVAMRTEADVSVAKVVCAAPQKGKDFGTCHYVVLGDAAGSLHIFNPTTGNLGAELDTGTGSPVVALHEFSARRNMTMLVTGHANGEVVLNEVREEVPRVGPRGKNAPEPLRSARSATVHHLLLNSSTWAAHMAFMTEAQPADEWAADPSQEMPGVQFLETFKCGRQRCFAVAFSDGTLAAYYDNSTLRNFDGITMAGERPLALRVSVAQLTVVYPSGIAFMPVRRRPDGDNEIKLHICKGLNESSLVAYQWDALVPSRGYAVTDLGDLLVVITGSGGPRTDSGKPNSSPGTQCFVRSRSSAALPSGPLALAHIKGYLFAASPTSIGVFNTTNYYRQGILEVAVEPLENLAQELEHTLTGPGKPVLATDRDRLVLVGLSGGAAAVYHSDLYVMSPYDMSDLRAWTQPLFIAAMIIVGVWQFYRAKTNKGGGRGNQSMEKMLKGLPPHLRQEVSQEMSRNDGRSSRRPMGGGSRFR